MTGSIIVKALIRYRKQLCGIIIEVGETVDDLCGNPQPTGVVTMQ